MRKDIVKISIKCLTEIEVEKNVVLLLEGKCPKWSGPYIPVGHPSLLCRIVIPKVSRLQYPTSTISMPSLLGENEWKFILHSYF